MFSIGRKFLTHVIPGVLRPLHILWNEVIGFVFLCFGIVATPRAIREIMAFTGEPDQLGRIALFSAFILTMFGFGIGSFLRARKIKKS